ncbi:MAG: DNA recombination protein RmuC [Bacteroidales bacterium]|nr:DNA recombination protein RmuC [Bacteroidales bacterium]
MLTEILIGLVLLVSIIILIVVFLNRNNKSSDKAVIELKSQLDRFEQDIKNEFRLNREESSDNSQKNRKELTDSLNIFRSELNDTMTKIMELTSNENKKLRDEIAQTFTRFQESFDKNVQSFNELQREKFNELDLRQNKLLESTEKRLDQMRATVEEKLEKTLSERLGQSFETVGKQLQLVQQGLGEMRNLAQDVGGLKKVLSGVKVRGMLGELQLEMLLEQILAPEQFEANVKTKHNSNDRVEFAVKLPGRDDINSTIWLPIDAKFPKDIYEQLIDAYDTGEKSEIDTAKKNMDSTIKSMAKDISSKYIDPPYTTDFAIMFLPFENLYAEVVRDVALMEELRTVYKVVVTGPTTLAAILNSLQMGFKTLAIQKHSSEVWKILGAVKTEFDTFGEMLNRAQSQIEGAGKTIELLSGRRTRAIKRKLRDVEALPISESKEILPELSELEEWTDEDDE